MHVMGNCPQSDHPPLREAPQETHVTDGSTSMWRGTGTMGALTPVSSSLINRLSLCLYKSRGGKRKSSESFCQVPVISVFVCLFVFSFAFNLSGPF